jgi:GAF domain-containing protein
MEGEQPGDGEVAAASRGGGEAESDLVLSIYQCVTREDALHQLLSLLARRFRCVAGALAFTDPARPGADVVMTYGVIDEAAMARYRRDFAHLDPAPRLLAGLPLGSVTSTGRVFDAVKLAADPFFQGWYQPLGLEETLGGPIARGDGRFGIIGIQRNRERPPFDDSDIEAFGQLMPHLVQAIELRRAFFGLERRIDALEATIEPAPVGLMLFRAGTLSHANLAARTILGRADGLILDRAGRLRASEAATDRRLREAIAAPGLGGLVLSIPRDTMGRIYGLRITKLPATLADGHAADTAVVITDPERRQPDGARVVAELFSMPPAAAQLAAALANGEDLQGYADRTGVSLNTAKFHLKAAFLATGTRRQADLVRQIGVVVRDLA